MAHLKSGEFVAMPSQVAGDLWHELALYTRNYEAFCEKAFGRFMHLTPAVALDAKLNIPNGFRYTPRRKPVQDWSSGALVAVARVEMSVNLLWR